MKEKKTATRYITLEAFDKVECKTFDIDITGIGVLQFKELTMDEYEPIREKFKGDNIGFTINLISVASVKPAISIERARSLSTKWGLKASNELSTKLAQELGIVQPISEIKKK